MDNFLAFCSCVLLDEFSEKKNYGSAHFFEGRDTKGGRGTSWICCVEPIEVFQDNIFD
jgi:hypothetical protein